MSKAYSPEEITQKWYEFWEKKRFFHSEPDGRPSYCIVIPPPNVTGALHMGHALNNTIQDVLTRFHRMKNLNACWIPGTDHAGIATQSVVAKKLLKEDGKRPYDLGREAFLEKVWQWKETYGNRILMQLKKLGCSCDWDRTCFTMDDKLSHAVRVVFLQLFKDGLLYRSKRLINWCPGCRTALSDDELVRTTCAAKMWQIHYPIKDSDEKITVATTRPETMLGDTAVAVNPGDERHKHLIGKTCILPLMNREIPIIGDGILAQLEKGTGAVKVTPAHDPNDYACGFRNNLPMVNILNDDGTLNENAGKYQGLKVLEAREKVLEDLKALDLLGKIENIEHSVECCYRTNDIIEPYLSDQWFVRMAPLVELAKKAVLDKEVVFFPAKRTDDYMYWLDHTPDWCISRQIWWGHRIPIWYCRDCHKDIIVRENGENVKIPENVTPIVPETADAKAKPEKCPVCGGTNLVQDPDVLDTWFSSQLWPLSTLGWPEETKDLKYYYPTSVLVTARDIIALWVARMVMMGMKFRDKKPFSHVLINPTILDEKGNIMSKSRGNGFDPVKVIEGGWDHIMAIEPIGDIPADRIEHYPVYGCDAVRYGLMSMTTGEGQDIKIIIQRTARKKKEYDTKITDYNPKIPQYDVKIPLLEEGRRFCNKIWQACHGVIFANCQDVDLSKEDSPYLEDKWLSDKLHALVENCTKNLEIYHIGETCEQLYRFFWDDLCSWYLEIVKPRLWGEQGNESKQYAQAILVRATDTFLRLLHPIMPFISEDLWQTLRPSLVSAKKTKLAEACIIAQWPSANKFKQYPDVNGVVELAREITTTINNIRAEHNLAPSDKVPKAIFTGENAHVLESLSSVLDGIKKLTKIESIEAKPNQEKPARAAVRMVRDVIVYIPLEGLVDFEKEKAKLDEEIQNVQEQITRLEGKLANSEYTTKAPQDLVRKDQERLQEYRKRKAQLEEQRKTL